MAAGVLSYGEILKEDGDGAEPDVGEDTTMAEADDDSFEREGAGSEHLHTCILHVHKWRMQRASALDAKLC